MKKLLKLLVPCFALLIIFGVNSNSVSAKKKIETDPDKVVVIIFYDDHCSKIWCPEIKKKLQICKEKYGDKIAIHEIDVTSSKRNEAEIQAKKLGVSAMLFDAPDYVPMVGVVSKRRNWSKTIIGAKGTIEKYSKAIDDALAKD